MDNNTKEVKQKIRQIIMANLPQGNSEDVPYEADLFSLGFSSLNAVPLVLELEEAFKFEFDMDEIQYDNFQTIGDIIKLVSRKVSGSA